MANDLSNKEKLVAQYISELAKNEFPNADMSEHGAFMEMFVIPHIKLLTPLLEEADRIKLMQSLDNAELMSEEEMNELAAGHFFYRRGGEYARGYITLSFDDIPANGVIQIPADTEAESKQGYRYRSIETVVLNERELANYYNAELFRYEVPVFFEAENPGTQYNIQENEIARIVTPLDHLIEARNDAAFTGGMDKETNIELANRIRETSGSPNPGVERGWKRFIYSFDGVEDVIVAGYGHPLMKRDIIGKVMSDKINQTVPVDVHWGGKVDLHIRGKRLVETVETKVLIESEEGQLIIPLDQHPTHDILEITFSSPRYTDPDLDDSFFVVRNFVLMKDEDRETIGTLFEKSWVVIDDDRLQEDDVVTVRYRYNALFENIQESLYEEANRPPASDVLLKESRKKFLHGAVIVKLHSIAGINEKDRSVIRQRMYNYIEELPTGAELQFSDLMQPLYQFDEDDSIDTRVDYLQLPFQFIVTDHDNRYLYYCLSQEKREFLDKVQSASLYFAEWIPFYKDSVTVYDFFDIMHILTYQNAAKGAWEELKFRGYEWGRKIHFVNLAKRMLAYVNSVQRLSPTKWQAQQNEYFELGDLAIYEDTRYTDFDLENYINVLEVVANRGGEERDVNNILHLVVYCSVILYVLASDQTGGLTVKDFFEWLIDLTKGTPIDYQVHH